MALPNTINHHISLTDAAKLTKAFRDANPHAIKGGLFFKEQILEMLAQSETFGMRYYYGIDSSQKPVLVLTAVNGDGNDLYEGILLELAAPCPEICSTNNPLNNN
jgi:hypothetical protein